MLLWSWLLMSLALYLAGVSPLRAAGAGEKRAWTAAVNSLNDGFYDYAEKGFAEFVRKYPESEQRAEAVLRQAQARFELKNFLGAAKLLAGELNQAGVLSDQYRRWLAEAHYASGAYAAAAEAYAQLLKEFPGSPLRLQAAFGEAHARSRLQDWPRVVALLRESSGAFQQSAQARPDDPLVVRGQLLLAEALLAQKDYRAGEKVLDQLAPRPLTPEFAWRRQYLLCRLQLADQRLEQALEGSTNLLALAVASQPPRLRGESVVLQGSIFEQMGRVEAAIQTYENNLADGLPVEQRRQALLKIIELTLARNDLTNTIQRLERFSAEHPQDPALDLAQLTLGELRLKQYLTFLGNPPASPADAPAAPTNLLQQALMHFNRVIRDFPQSQLAGKAWLNRGWCLWTAEKMADSQAAFGEAAKRLPWSEDQAVARFKLADAQFQQKDYTNAALNYRLVLKDYDRLPAVTNELFAPAYYQVLRASLAVGDMSGAEEAVNKLLQQHPDDSLSQKSLLLMGQTLSQAGKSAEARTNFSDFVQRFPKSRLLAEVQRAIARAYVAEKDWPAAMAQYDAWVTNHVEHPALPEVEFDRAWVNFMAGQETNALALFTNFVARFPTNTLAPLAQWSVADFYSRQGDPVSAELKYKRLFQDTNWPPSELTFRARLAAGREAVRRRGLTDAQGYFTWLITNGPPAVPASTIPPSIVAQAYYALGDAFIEEATEVTEDAVRTLRRYGEAINALNKIPLYFPDDPLVPLAWGRIGDCHLQLASQDNTRYENALDAYRKVVASPLADASARSQAEVGLGIVCEKQTQGKAPAEQTALLKQAQEYYLNVFYEKNLRDGERRDPKWVREAGLAAARLAEAQQQWDQAVDVCRRLAELLPPLKSAMEKKIESLQKNPATKKS